MTERQGSMTFIQPCRLHEWMSEVGISKLAANARIWVSAGAGRRGVVKSTELRMGMVAI